jgi:hypothetical protein
MFSFLGIQTLRQLIETKDFKAIGVKNLLDEKSAASQLQDGFWHYKSKNLKGCADLNYFR